MNNSLWTIDFEREREAGTPTFWGCSDTWQANLMTAVDLPKDEMMKLHERILASVRCQEVELEPTFPLFDPPPGRPSSSKGPGRITLSCS